MNSITSACTVPGHSHTPQQVRQSRLGLGFALTGMMAGCALATGAAIVGVTIAMLPTVVFYGLNGCLAFLFGAGYFWTRSCGWSCLKSAFWTSAVFAVMALCDIVLDPLAIAKLVSDLVSMI